MTWHRKPDTEQCCGHPKARRLLIKQAGLEPRTTYRCVHCGHTWTVYGALAYEYKDTVIQMSVARRLYG